MNRDELAPRIEAMRSRFSEIERSLAAPDAYSNPKEYQRLSRERVRLSSLFSLYDQWCDLLDAIDSNKELLISEQDPEFRAIIESEIAQEEADSTTKEQ